MSTTRIPCTFLCSFRPLAETEHGREAIKQFGLPPFVDASCRREPDLESDIPSISALCRGPYFAPKLNQGDKVAYITRKGQFLGLAERHWRLVAVLKVAHSFKSHADAADWYRAKGLPLPGNCMVRDNPPLPLEKTDRYCSDLRQWEAGYWKRARQCGVFHVCEALFRDLHQPPAVTEATMRGIFGRIPNTFNPPAIGGAEYEQLVALC